MKRTLLVSACVIVASAGCQRASHANKTLVTYQSYLPVLLPAYEGDVETVVGHPGRIPELSGKMRQAKDSPHVQALVFNTIRYELTNQLRDDDYALIGWMGAVGTGHCNSVQLEEAMATRAKQMGGDVVLVYSNRLQNRPPFAYILSGHERDAFYGNTSYPTYTPSPVHAGVARFPQAEAFVLRSCSGIDYQINRILALDPETASRLEMVWRATEAEAALGHPVHESLLIGSESPLPGRTWFTESSATWSKFAQQSGSVECAQRAGIDERLIVQEVVTREITGQTPRTDRWGRFWKASGNTRAVE